MKVKLFISALIAALFVMGPMAHAATHDITPDSTHEFVECYGCSVAVAAVDEIDKYSHPRIQLTQSNITASPVLVSRFDNYSSRAPPTK